jgi:hypothetical protein
LAEDAENKRKAQEAKEAAIRSTPDYKRNSARNSIVQLRQRINNANNLIDEENRVGAISGYVNAVKLHELGSLVVFLEKEMRKEWEIYKSNGGTESSIYEIK